MVTFNATNFALVINHIKAHPESWNQSIRHCGTAHCFAGHAQLLSGKPANNATVRRDARIWLGLSLSDADWLFSGNRTLADFEAYLSELQTHYRYGFDRFGYASEGFDLTGYNCYGFDRAGFDRSGFNHKGFDSEGFDRYGYNLYGFNRDGYNRAGYNCYGFDRSGFNNSGFDWEGFDRAGFGNAGFDRDGFDSHGFDRDGLDKNNTVRTENKHD